MGTKTKMNKAKRLTADQQLIAGLKKYLGDKGTLVLEGRTVTGAEIVAMLLANVDASTAADAAYATWKRLVREERTTREGNKHTLALVRTAILVMYGSSDEKLAEFGLMRRKTRKPATVEKLAASVGKAKKTRAAHAPKPALVDPTTPGTGTPTAPKP
jgi:hypothetical protein